MKKNIKKKSRSAKGERQLLIKKDDLVMREEGEDALLFDPDSGSIKVLNYTGKFVWKLLNGRRTKEEIKASLLKKFKGVKESQIEKDLELFFKDLEELGYIGKAIKS